MLCPYLKTEPVMPIQAASNLSRPVSAMPELMEVLLSAVLGTGLVLMLGFFLSLESWVVSMMGFR
jgi:hypothetical protein